MHEMNDDKWHSFFEICADVLAVRKSPTRPIEGGSWCCFTTFSRLADVAGYWASPVPTLAELQPTYLGEGNWSQYFHYDELCHVIIPRTFGWDRMEDGEYVSGEEVQDVDSIAHQLNARSIPHRVTPLLLEIRCY